MTDHQRDLEAMNPPPFTPPERVAAHDCDGTATCPAALRIDALHPPTCLGLYRTDAELVAKIVPSVSELQRRMRDESTLRALVRRERGGV